MCEAGSFLDCFSNMQSLLAAPGRWKFFPHAYFLAAVFDRDYTGPERSALMEPEAKAVARARKPMRLTGRNSMTFPQELRGRPFRGGTCVIRVVSSNSTQPTEGPGDWSRQPSGAPRPALAGDWQAHWKVHGVDGPAALRRARSCGNVIADGRSSRADGWFVACRCR